MAQKQHWQGQFNIVNEDFKLSTDAYTEEQARKIMVMQIAKIKKVSPRVVSGWLEKHPHSCEIRSSN